MGLEGNLSGEKGMLESREVGVNTSSSFFFPVRLCGFGARAGGTKVRRREKGKRIS